MLNLGLFSASDATISNAVIFQCGGCQWIKGTGGNLGMTGPSDCGIGCPAVLDISMQGITSIDPGAFNTTGLQSVEIL